jgi:phage shock protein C
MKRYYRSRTSNIVGGVCGGLGDYTGIDPIFWRFAFLIAFNFFPPSAWVYIGLWISANKEPKI